MLLSLTDIEFFFFCKLALSAGRLHGWVIPPSGHVVGTDSMSWGHCLQPVGCLLGSAAPEMFCSDTPRCLQDVWPDQGGVEAFPAGSVWRQPQREVCAVPTSPAHLESPWWVLPLPQGWKCARVLPGWIPMLAELGIPMGNNQGRAGECIPSRTDCGDREIVPWNRFNWKFEPMCLFSSSFSVSVSILSFNSEYFAFL